MPCNIGIGIGIAEAGLLLAGIDITKSQKMPPKLAVPLRWPKNSLEIWLSHYGGPQMDQYFSELAKLANTTEFI